MRRISFLILLAIGLGGAQDLTPPQISSYSANPNPFSPNGDGIADSTQIQFALSEPAYVWIWESTSGTYLVSGTYFLSGFHTLTWDGSGLSEGPHLLLFAAVDPAGNASDTASLTVVIDTTPPMITNVSFVPNPFSPDDNGIEDYCQIQFTVTGTHDPDYDQYFPPNRIGMLTVFRDSISQQQIFVPDHVPELPPFPVYLYVTVLYTNMTSNLTLNFVDWASEVVQVVIPPGAQGASFRVGDLTNKISSISVWANPLTVGDSAVVALYAFTGNAAVEIFDSLGNKVLNANLWPKFHGDGTYFILWGPGPIPDGLYNVKITVEDEAYNTDLETGEVIANSIPTTVSEVYADPPKISPQNQDFLFDAANVHFTISEAARVTVRIYNSPTHFDSLHLVRTLLENQWLEGGPHALPFDGRNDAGQILAQDSDSTYTIVVSAVDPLTGDMANAVAQIEIDNLPPPAPVLFPLPSPTSDTTDTLEGVGEPGSKIQIYRNFLFYDEVVADSVTGYFKAFIHYSAEDNQIFALALDDVLNAGPPSETLRVVVDQSPPTVVETYPSHQSTVRETLAVIWARVQDDLAGVNFYSSQLVLKREGISVPGTPRIGLPDTLVFELTSPLTPGGADDGHYQMEITLYDSAGNTKVDTVRFIYDTSPPQMALSPQDSSVLTHLDTLWMWISDDLSGPSSTLSSLFLWGPNGDVPAQALPLGDSLLALIPTPPLKRDGTDDGRYWLAAIAKDRAGNTTTDTITMLYDTQPPIALRVYPPADSAFSHQILEVYAVLSDSVVPGREPSGLDLAVSDLYLLDPGASVHPGHLEIRGDTLAWVFNTSLTTTGAYTIVGHFYDRAGNVDTLQSIFFYDPEPPHVMSSDPLDGSAVRGELSQVSVYLTDGAGSGLDPDPTVTYLEVYDEHGTWVGGVSSLVGDTLQYTFFSPLLPNGSMDGGYRVFVHAADRVGNPIVPNPDTLSFVFDNLAPWVENRSPQDGALLAEFPDSVWVELSDLVPGIQEVSGIDFWVSTIWMVGPDGQGVPGIKHIRDDGDGTGALIWVVNGAYTPPYGTYTVYVDFRDRAGNANADTFSFQYLPTVNVEAWVNPPDGAFVSGPLDRVEAVLIAPSGAGILFDTAWTWIRVLDRNGVPMPGWMEYTDTSMIYHLSPPLDPSGSQDGHYWIVISAYDNLGNTLPQNPDTLRFIYDNIPPSTTGAFPGDSVYTTAMPESVYVEVTDLVTQFILDLRPVPNTRLRSGLRNTGKFQLWQRGPFVKRIQSIGLEGPEPLLEVSGIDWDHSVIRLWTPDSVGVPGVKHVQDNGDGSGTLIWVMEPGWSYEYGWYKVTFTLVDRAGNAVSGSFTFRYAEQAPVEVSVSPEGYVSGEIPVVTATVSSQAGVPIDFTASGLLVLSPSGEVLDGSLSNNGTDQMSYTLTVPLPSDGTRDGTYRVVVWAQDMAGNSSSPYPDTTIFVLDNLPPHIVEAVPPENADLYHPPDSIMIVITDAYSWVDSSAGLNLEASRVFLIEPDGTTVVPGTFRYHVGEEGTGILVYRIDPANVWQEDVYRVRFTLYDVLGNVVQDEFPFTLRGAWPHVLAISPDSGSITNRADTLIVTVWDPTWTGLDETATFTRLLTATGQEVPLQRTFTPQDTLVIIRVVPLTSLSDGLYTFEVRPVAQNGVEGEFRRSTFLLDATPPFITETFPENGGVLYTPISQLSVRYEESGSGLDPAAVQIRVWDVPTGNLRPITQLQITDTLITAVLAEPLSQGIYAWSVALGDSAGNAVVDTFAFQISLPMFITFTIQPGDTVYGPVSIFPANIQSLSGAAIVSVEMKLGQVRPQDTLFLPGHTVRLGDVTWGFVLDTLLPADGSANGFYALTATATDDSGNVVSGAVGFTFIYDTIPPPVPTLLEPLPEVVETSFVDLRGQTEPGAWVLVFVNDMENPVDSTVANEYGLYQFLRVPLVYDTWNTIGLLAKDLYGNRSDLQTYQVYSGPMEFTVKIPKPITRDANYIVVTTPEPATITWWIYNLEGNLVTVLRYDFERRLTEEKLYWGLTDEVMNGPYLYIIEARLKHSQRVEIKKGILAVIR